MNLEKAIEIKEEMHSLGIAPYDEESTKADRLSIEALKRIKEYREHITPKGIWLLPGETKG